ncbi:hypothetical protein Tco_0525774 [Tanacetum coccineum]
MYHFQTTHIESLSYLVLLIYDVTLSDPYSAATLFGGVTDWYLEPRFGGFRHDEPEAPQSPGQCTTITKLRPVQITHLAPDYVPGLRSQSRAPLSPYYIPDQSPGEEDPEEYPADYPADGGDDDDESSRDDADDEDEEEDEEEEHLASADSTALHTIDPVSSVEDKEAFEIDEFAPTPPRSPRLRRAGISVRLPPPMAASMEARIIEYAAAPTPPSPPPSLLTQLSSPLPQIPSPPLPLLSPPTHTSPTYAEAPLGYRAAKIWLRAASPSTHHQSEIPLPPLLLPSTTHKDDIPEDMPLRREPFSAPTSRLKRLGEFGLLLLLAGWAALTSKCLNYDSMILWMLVSVLLRIERLSSSEDDRALLRAQAWAHSKSRSQAMEAQFRALQRDSITTKQRIRDRGQTVRVHKRHKHDRFRELVRTVEAGPQDGPADAGSSC